MINHKKRFVSVKSFNTPIERHANELIVAFGITFASCDLKCVIPLSTYVNTALVLLYGVVLRLTLDD